MDTCKNGHALSGDNVRVLTIRQCKTCDRDQRRYRYQTDPEYRARALARQRRYQRKVAGATPQ